MNDLNDIFAFAAVVKHKGFSAASSFPLYLAHDGQKKGGATALYPPTETRARATRSCFSTVNRRRRASGATSCLTWKEGAG
jgi:hypothetical protein